MFDWITKDRVRIGLRIIWSVLMAFTLFTGEYLLAIFSVLMLILMETEDINKKLNES